MAQSVITFEAKGSFRDTEEWLRRISRDEIFQSLNQYGREGVAALSAATPVESGETANSWQYTVYKKGRSYGIVWSNTHIQSGVNVAVLIQYGHGTRNGGYVYGRDYINPAIQPIFDRIVTNIWKEVTRR